MATRSKRTVLSALTNIIDAARYNDEHMLNTYYSYDDALMKKVQKDAKFLAKQLEITAKQAVLFAIILEISEGKEFSKSDLSKALKTNFVQLLSYEEDLKVLERAFLIQRCRWGKIKIGEEVQKCLERNIAFHKPSNEKLTTYAILFRISSLFKAMENETQDTVLALLMIDDMIQRNPNTSIAKVASKYGILTKGDALFDFYESDDLYKWQYIDYKNSMTPQERFLFYAMCYRYFSHNDDCCCWWDFRNFFTDRNMEQIQQRYGDESLDLQMKHVIVYVSYDGLFVKDHFKIDDPVQEEIWADLGGLPEQTPMAGTLRHGELVAKKLFYDDVLEREVSTLSSLLSEERYEHIRTALKKNGMRSGFTCLFYGSPGTGKTETVYQLARQTGRDIIMADVTKLKSMWVGESEKNLKNLFSKYRRLVKDSKVTPILLFNEADAVFGIRKSGAEGAVDKMENSLQNIILQEMEDLQGILIATTNLSENFDKAFERRFL